MTDDKSDKSERFHPIEWDNRLDRKLFHIGDVLSVVFNTKVSRIKRPNYPDNTPAAQRTPSRLVTGQFSDQGKYELLQFMLADEWSNGDAREKAGNELLSQHPFLKNIPNPPASYEHAKLTQWLEEQEKKCQWVEVTSLENPEKKPSKVEKVYKDKSSPQFHNITEDEAGVLEPIQSWKLAQAVVSLSRLGHSTARLEPGDIEEAAPKSGHISNLVLYPGSVPQTQACFTALKKHFHEVGLEKSIKHIPRSGDDEYEPIEITVSTITPKQLERLLSYTREELTRQLIEKNTARQKEFNNLKPREIADLKKRLPHPELPLAIASLLKNKGYDLNFGDIREYESQSPKGYSFTIPESSNRDINETFQTIQRHMAEAKLGNSIDLHQTTGILDGIRHFSPAVIVKVNTEADEETVDIPKFTAYVRKQISPARSR
jgi:hypothetical protein